MRTLSLGVGLFTVERRLEIRRWNKFHNYVRHAKGKLVLNYLLAYPFFKLNYLMFVVTVRDWI